MLILSGLYLWIIYVTSPCYCSQYFDVTRCRRDSSVTCRFISPNGADSYDNNCLNAVNGDSTDGYLARLEKRRLLQRHPQHKPTHYPTGNTSSPTDYPTFLPSGSPIVEPTETPSDSPSLSPTYSPSSSPSRPPTLAPTMSPSQPPTNAPTYIPSSSPSQPPTRTPSMTPTLAPTQSSCATMEHVLGDVAKSGNVIVFESGNYLINYTTQLIGLSNIIFATVDLVPLDTDGPKQHYSFKPSNNTRLIFNLEDNDFNNRDNNLNYSKWNRNYNSMFNIINSTNITFQDLIFTTNDYLYEAYNDGANDEIIPLADNDNNISSIIGIYNSDNVEFNSVSFDYFNVKSPANSVTTTSNDTNSTINDTTINTLTTTTTTAPPVTIQESLVATSKNLEMLQNKMNNKSWTCSFKYKYVQVSNNSNFYVSPKTDYLWSSSEGIQLTGDYEYTKNNGSTFNFISCNGSSETPGVGIGCSKGAGNNTKVLPTAYWSNNGTSRICQDIPDIYGTGTCDTAFVYVLSNCSYHYVEPELLKLEEEGNDLIASFALIDVRSDLNSTQTNSLTLENCVFKDNSLENGFLIKAFSFESASRVDISNTSIYDNNFTNSGGLMYLENSGLMIDSAVIQDNTFSDISSGGNDFQRCMICANFSDDNVMFDYLHNYEVGIQVADSVFENNGYVNYGGVFYIESGLMSPGLIEMDNTVFGSNVATEFGGVLAFISETTMNSSTHAEEFCDSSSFVCGLKLLITNNNFTHNSVHLQLNVNSTQVVQDPSEYGGGALYFRTVYNHYFPTFTKARRLETVQIIQRIWASSELNIFNCLFENNEIYYNITNNNRYHNDSRNHNVNHNDSSTKPKHQRNDESSDLNIANGGALSLHYEFNLMNPSSLNSNTAKLDIIENWILFEIDSCTFTQNFASDNGAAMYVTYSDTIAPDYDYIIQKFANISHTNFTSNEASNAPVLYFDLLTYIMFQMYDCNVDHNVAFNDYGSMTLLYENGMNMDIKGCSFSHNIVRNGTGAALAVLTGLLQNYTIAPATNSTDTNATDSTNTTMTFETTQINGTNRNLLSVANSNEYIFLSQMLINSNFNISINNSNITNHTKNGNFTGYNSTIFISPPPTAMPTELYTTTLIPTQAPITFDLIPDCSQLSITDSLFEFGFATQYGGSIYSKHFVDAGCIDIIVNNSQFNRNHAGISGGAISSHVFKDYNYNTTHRNVPINIKLNECEFFRNNAPNYGGTIEFDGEADDNCTNFKNQRLYLFNSNMSLSNVTESGAAIYAKCGGIESFGNRFMENAIVFDTDSTPSTSSCGDDDDSDCFEEIANYISDSYGGTGAAIYAYNCDLNITNCAFENNKVNIGNGGAIYRKIEFSAFKNESFYNATTLDSLYSNNITFELIIANNSFVNNSVGSIIDEKDNDLSCEDISGLSGFGGAVWLDLKEDFTNKYYSTLTKDTILIKNNTFESNDGSFIEDIYFNLYYPETLNTMKKIRDLSSTNTFVTDDISTNLSTTSGLDDNSTMTTTISPETPSNYGSSPVNITNLHLVSSAQGDGSINCNESCLGFVLPGDLFQVNYDFTDFWHNPSFAISSCPQVTYTASEDVELQGITIDTDENDVTLTMSVENAKYDTQIHVYLTDLHYVIDSYDTSSYHFSVITTLCSIGTAVDIFGHSKKLICSVNDMTGVSFSCETTCSGTQYLFTRWEPACYECPALGATCSGDNMVILDYAYYGLVNKTEQKYDSNELCFVEIESYLCPSGLCCTELGGCTFDNTNDSYNVLCAKNRDPSVYFCGKCHEGYSEVYGSYSCSDKCGKDANEHNLYLVLVPIVGCMLLLIYFLFVKDAFSATPLFGYIFKTLLFFYQTLPILVYEGYISMIMQCVKLFNLDFISALLGRYDSNGQSNGICLWPGMTSMDKLLLGFLTPTVVLIELLILRIIPVLYRRHKKRRKSKERAKSQSQSELDEFGGHHSSQPLMQITTNQENGSNKPLTSGQENAGNLDTEANDNGADNGRLSVDFGFSVNSITKRAQSSKNGSSRIPIGAKAKSALENVLLADEDRDDDYQHDVNDNYSDDDDDNDDDVDDSDDENGNQRRKKKSSSISYFVRRESWSFTRPNSLRDDTYTESVYSTETEENSCFEKVFWCLCCFGCHNQVCKRKQRWNMLNIFDNLSDSIVRFFNDAFWNSILIIYMPIAESTIKMFNCSHIKHEKKYYLWYAGEYECLQWWQYPFIILFVIILIFPFFIVIRLYGLRKDTQEYRNKKTGETSVKIIELPEDKLAHKRHRLYSAFTANYCDKCWWYESIMIGRRIVLISVYAFPKSDLLLLKCMLTFICGIIFGIHINYKPFKHKINNIFETIVLILLFFISSLSAAATYESTYSSQTAKMIKMLILICSIVPLVPIPFLLRKYWKSNVKPKIKRFSENRRQKSLRSERAMHMVESNGLTNASSGLLINNHNMGASDNNYNDNNYDAWTHDKNEDADYARMSGSDLESHEDDNTL